MASFGPLQSARGWASSNFDFTHLSIHASTSKQHYDQLITQTGEATGHYGQECPSCGRHPRIPYVNYQEWPQEKT